MFITYTIPKNLSKNSSNLANTDLRFSSRFPLPNLEIGGSILSTSVPVVLILPVSKAVEINLRVSASLRFSVSIMVFIAFSFSSAT